MGALGRVACQYLSYILLVNTRGQTLWRKMERKSEWSSWTVADVAAGMSGFRAETKGQLSAPSANHLGGTSPNSRPIDPAERPAATPVTPPLKKINWAFAPCSPRRG